MRMYIIVVCLVFTISTQSMAQDRGMWIWVTNNAISSNNNINRVINQCVNDGVTDIYMYAYGYLSGGDKTNMQAFISKATCVGIDVWAMDGYRAYFSDWSGPSNFYGFINDVINYNATSAVDERFVGVHSDNEPQDGQSEPLSSFHNGLRDNQLSTVPGSGVWQSTQALDREMLMRDWLTTHETSYNTCHANGMLYGAAIPSWTDDYYGQPVYCTYNSTYARVMEHLMNYLDDYCIMSYNTNPANAFNRVVGELTYAETLPPGNRPRIWAGLETHCGVGNTISYCDTPGKQSKAAFWTDVATIEASASGYTSYHGMNIHDWIGWRYLTPEATDVSDPGPCIPQDVELGSFNGQAEDEGNVLTWTTQLEENASHFEIEKSFEGVSFESIGIVNAFGTTALAQAYQFLDHDIIDAGISYYRLKMVDTDGSYEYSKVIAVDRKQQLIISLYPIPVDEVLTIQSSELNLNDALVQLVDMTGKVHYSTIQQPGGDKIELMLADIPPGVYILQLSGQSFGLISRKFIKGH